MKLSFLKRKRVWIPSSLVGLLGVLLVWGAIEDQQWIGECNAGVYEYCKRILDDTKVDSDEPVIDTALITTEEGKAQLAKAQAEVDALRAEAAAKAEAEAKIAAEAKAKEEALKAQKLAEEVERRRAIARANGHDVTLANFNSLRSGMSYQQVKAILGKDGTVSSESHVAGYHTIMYSWYGPRNDGANMNAMFQNGRLINKAQFGLR